MTPPAEVDRLLGYMPIIIRAPDISDWERQFCISIVGRIQRGAFCPTDKQIRVMTRIVDAFQSAVMTDEPIVEQGNMRG